MNYLDSLNTSDTSDESSIFSSNCFEDISSIQSLSFNTYQVETPSSNPFLKRRYTQEPSETSHLDSLYQENEMLKRKIQSLEKSLKSQGMPSTAYEDAFQYKSWIRSNTQYFTDSHNDSCIKSLSEEFGSAWEAGPVKRSRTFGSEKEPQKFLKLAMMKMVMIKMSSVKKSQTQDKFVKTGKKMPEPRKSLQAAHSPTISAVKSPIRIIKTMKSQSNIFYPKKISIKRPAPAPTSPTYTITIKSVEKKVDLLKDSEEPSPIISKSKKGFYSMTEEEYKDFNLFLKEMNK